MASASTLGMDTHSDVQDCVKGKVHCETQLWQLDSYKMKAGDINVDSFFKLGRI